MSKAAADHAQRLHDLHTVRTDFKSVLRLLEAGYRFDDNAAPAAFEQLREALKLLEKEIRMLETEWKVIASTS